MRKYLILLTLLLGAPTWAASGTVIANTATDVEASVRLRWGCGFIRVGNAASAAFGGGTLTLKQLDASGAWATVSTYTVVPSPNPERLDFGGVETDVGVSLAGATAPSLFWQIESGNCGAR